MWIKSRFHTAHRRGTWLTDLAGVYEKGRGRKGLIFTFPAGNGRDHDDTCGSDGYVNSIHTIAVAGVDYDGSTTYYSERCAAVMASVYAGNRKNKLPYNMVSRIGLLICVSL